MTRWRILATVGVWLVLWIGLVATDSSPAGPPLGAIVAVTAAAIFVSFDLGRAVSSIEWTRRRQLATPAGDDPRATTLRRQIYGAWAGSTEVHDTLVELIDDRLWFDHHIDRAADPEAAMTALTPRLQRVVAGQRRRDVLPTELRQILSDIEAL